MKIQDVLFFIIFLFTLWKKDIRLSVIFGIGSLFIAIPFFAGWIFFTAERLTWYAAAFFLLSICFYFLGVKKKE